MEEIDYKILNIEEDNTVDVKGRGFISIERTMGLVYSKKGKHVTEYFTNSEGLYEVVANIKGNALLTYYLRDSNWSSFLPAINSSEFGANIYFVDKEIIDKLDLVRSGSYYKKRENVKRRTDFKSKEGRNGLGRQFTPSLIKKEISRGYSSKKDWDTLSTLLGVTSNTYIATEGLKNTFGIELETSSGLVSASDYFINNLNISAVRDGSVRGSEYVTGVLKGDAGFNQLYRATKVINKQAKVDKTCGMHVHIGGASFNKAFSVYAHILSEKIEDSMFSIVSKSRRGNSYCGDVIPLKLDSLISKYGAKYGVEAAYDKLFKAMTYGIPPEEGYNKKYNHHYGRYCGKYNDIEDEDNFRYKWVNLIPCNFNVRNVIHPKNGYDKSSDTIEFRFHSGTLNYTKIKNFTLICMAFVDYVENHQREILSKKVITLEDIVSATYKRNAKPLLAYIDARQKLFNNEPDLLESSEVQKSLHTKKEIICV